MKKKKDFLVFICGRNELRADVSRILWENGSNYFYTNGAVMITNVESLDGLSPEIIQGSPSLEDYPLAIKNGFSRIKNSPLVENGELALPDDEYFWKAIRLVWKKHEYPILTIEKDKITVCDERDDTETEMVFAIENKNIENPVRFNARWLEGLGETKLYKTAIRSYVSSNREKSIAPLF